jgi:hypothetical protein
MIGDRRHRRPGGRSDFARAGPFQPMPSEGIDRDIEESLLDHVPPISSFERTSNL